MTSHSPTRTDRWTLSDRGWSRLEGTLNFRDIGGYPTVTGRRSAGAACTGPTPSTGSRTADQAQLIEPRHPARVGLPARPRGGSRREPAAVGRASTTGCRSGRTPSRPGRWPKPGGDAADRGRSDVTVEDVAEHVRRHARALRPPVRRGHPGRRRRGRPAHPLPLHGGQGPDRPGGRSPARPRSACPTSTSSRDYELTNEYRTPTRLKELAPELEEQGIDVETVLPLFSAQGPVMHLTLEALREEHGSIDAYLEDRRASPATMAVLPPTLVDSSLRRTRQRSTCSWDGGRHRSPNSLPLPRPAPRPPPNPPPPPPAPTVDVDGSDTEVRRPLPNKPPAPRPTRSRDS